MKFEINIKPQTSVKLDEDHSETEEHGRIFDQDWQSFTGHLYEVLVKQGQTFIYSRSV